MPATASPLCVRPIRVPQSGMPEMKERVPSIGSMTQTCSLSACSRAELLAQNAVAGIFGADHRTDGLLRLAVGLGDGIESVACLFDTSPLRGIAAASLRGCMRQAPQEVALKSPRPVSNCCQIATLLSVRSVFHRLTRLSSRKELTFVRCTINFELDGFSCPCPPWAFPP